MSKELYSNTELEEIDLKYELRMAIANTSSIQELDALMERYPFNDWVVPIAARLRRNLVIMQWIRNIVVGGLFGSFGLLIGSVIAWYIL